MVIIKGNLAADPKLNYVGTELDAVANGTVFSWQGHNARGERIEDVPIRYSAWGDQAQFLTENYRKGSKINLIGEERLNVYTDTDGIERRDITVRIIAILDDASMRALFMEVRNWSKQANEINFGIPARVNLGEEPDSTEDAEVENTDDPAPEGGGDNS